MGDGGGRGGGGKKGKGKMRNWGEKERKKGANDRIRKARAAALPPFLFYHSIKVLYPSF